MELKFRHSKHLQSLTILLVALAYFLGAKLGLLLAFSHQSVSPVWPPTGIAIGLSLLLGPLTFPGIYLGAFASNYLLTDVGPFLSAGIAFGNTLEAFTAYVLIRRFIPDILHFDRVKSLLLFVIFGAGVATSVGALVGATVLCSGGSAEWSTFWVLFRTWWVGDAGGALLITPLVIGLPGFAKHHWKLREVFEFAFLILAVYFTSEASFGNSGWTNQLREKLPLGFLNIPVFIWAAYRFRELGITILLGLQAAVTIRGTLAGAGPFARPDPNDSLIIVQIFLVSRAVAFHFLSCLIAELRQFRFISDNAIESHYLIDDTGKILYTNNIVSERLRYSKNELKNLGMESVCPAVTKTQIHKVLTDPSSGVHSIEVTHVRKDGSTYPAEATLIAIGENGRSRAFYVGRDISLRKEVETELTKKAEQLSKLNSELETFTSMVSHDLKSPLRNISNLAQLVHSKLTGKLDAEDSKLFQLIFDSCSRMNRLIHDLLASAQIGRQASENEHLEMMEILSAVLRGLDSQIRNLNARITTDPLPRFMGEKRN